MKNKNVTSKTGTSKNIDRRSFLTVAATGTGGVLFGLVFQCGCPAAGPSSRRRTRRAGWFRRPRCSTEACRFHHGERG